jgi:excisionase family DNA binding protein
MTQTEDRPVREEAGGGYAPLSAAKLFPGRTVLTVNEVAAALRVTNAHVKNMVEEGKLIAVNSAGTGGGAVASRKHWRIPVGSFDQFVRRNL